jgi:hypothetical protein
MVVLALAYSIEFGSSGGWLKMLACFDKGEVGHGEGRIQVACGVLALQQNASTAFHVGQFISRCAYTHEERLPFEMCEEENR